MNTVEIDALFSALDVESIAPPVPVDGGRGDARLWRVELAGGPHLLRIYDQYDEPVALREARILDYLSDLDFPVSRVAAMGNSDGHVLLLLEWIEGRTLGEVLATTDNPRQLGEQFGRLQSRLHGVDAPVDLPCAVSWPSLDAYPERLLEALDGLPQRRDRLLHLDYHPLNVLVHDGEISGLIDWTNTRRGDPRFDVARTYLLMRFAPGLDAQQEAALRPRLRSLMRSWHRSYRAEFGAIREIRLFLAWAAYGIVYDLERNPSGSFSPAAARALDQIITRLRREAERWMAGEGV